MRSFIVPPDPHRISEEEIKTGVLHLAAEFKDYFPDESCELTINYGTTIVRKAKFEHHQKGSHKLHVGRAFMINLDVNPSCKLKFREVMPLRSFSIERYEV